MKSNVTLRSVPLYLAVCLLFWAGPTWASDIGQPMDLSLDQAREQALQNDETLRQASLAIKGAMSDVMAASAGKLPQLDLSGLWQSNLKKPAFFLPPDLAEGFGGSNKVDMGGDWDLQGAVNMTWNLWTSGRLSAAGGAAQEALRATQWQKALVTDLVLYQVEKAYYDVLLAQVQVRISESALAAAEEAFRVTEAAFVQGTASNFDKLRAEVELSNRRTPVLQARNDRDIQTLTLKRLCALASDRDLTLTDRLDTVAKPAPLTDLLTDMHTGSAELAALKHMVAAGRQTVALAQAGNKPVVQLQGSYAIQGQWDDDLLPGSDETATSASTAIAVSIPIFDGYATRADVGQAEARLRSQEVELERVTRDRELTVRQARIHLENALLALDGRQDAVALAEEAHRLALVRLENGLATPLERLDAELALTTARTQLAEILHACNLARAALTLSVGTTTLSDASVLEVSK